MMSKAYTIANGVAKGRLKHGMKIGEVVHKEFEMREMTVEDMLDAEAATSTSNPLNYATELITRQLVRVGDFTGPFTMGMMKKNLKPTDWRLLREAQMELDALGEADSIGSDAV
ncbi:MAG: hypothetical protein C4516_04365 [Oxalobacter sp.]|nr:MAG: hypothetical protein C4516_04365 [Oxalobacter sp.]